LFDYVERSSERTKRAAETHHLGMTVARVALYDEEIEVAVRACITAGPRVEQHDLDRIVSDSRQRLARSLDDLLGNHGDTVAKPAGSGRSTVVVQLWRTTSAARSKSLIMQPADQRPRRFRGLSRPLRFWPE
jgi:preprotein translocase subunit SecD